MRPKVAVTGWTGQVLGSTGASRAKARGAPRSLGAALREAGLGDAAPDPRGADAVTRRLSNGAPALKASSSIPESRSPRLAVFDDGDDDEPQPATVKTAPPQSIVTPAPSVVTQASSVVSPPPWLRAARRGRWHARMLNTFGWVMTIAIAGSIIGLAGRYLAVPPLGMQTTMQARQ